MALWDKFWYNLPMRFILATISAWLVFFWILANSQPSNWLVAINLSSFLIICFGCSLNMLVVLSNTGKMPVESSLYPKLFGYDFDPEDHEPYYIAIGTKTRFPLLADRIIMPHSFVIPGLSRGLASIGDILAVAGGEIYILKHSLFCD